MVSCGLLFNLIYNRHTLQFSCRMVEEKRNNEFCRKYIGLRKKHALSWLRSLCFGDTPIRLFRHGKVFVDACNPSSSLSLHYLSTYFFALKVYINVALKPSRVKLRANESSIAPRSSF